MHSSKLILVLKSFSSKEIGRLDQFLRNPYFEEVKLKKKILELFDLLKIQYPQFSDACLDKKLVFGQLYPAQDFSALKMDKLMSILYRLIRKFIIVEKTLTEENELPQLLLLSTFFRERQLTNYFQQSIRQIRQVQERQKGRAKKDYLNDFLIEQEIAEFESFFNKRKENLNLQNTLLSLDVFYTLTKLEFCCRLLSQHKYNVPLDIPKELGVSGYMIRQIKNHPRFNIPVLQAFYQAFLLLSDKNDTSIYFNLKMLLEQERAEIPFEQLQDLQAICRSYCASQYNRGTTFFLEEGFRLYQTHLKEGSLYHNNGLIPGIIKNIVNVGLSLQQYEWVLEFLQQHQNRVVGTDFPDEVYRFNLSLYHFAIQNYQAALDHLANKYEDTYYKLAGKRLELKIYFEQRSELLDAKMESFKVFIFRIAKKNRLTDLHFTGNNNFIDLLRQIHHPRTYQNSKRILNIRQKILSKSALVEKKWLLQTLDKQE